MAIFTKKVTIDQFAGVHGTVECELVFTELTVNSENRTKTIRIQIYTTASVDGVNPVNVSIQVPASEYSWQYDEWNVAVDKQLKATPTKTLRLAETVTFPLDIDGRSAIWYTVLRTRWDADEECYIGTTGKGDNFFLTQEAEKREFGLAYNLNGGTGRLGTQTHYGTVTLHSMIPTREGYTFINWNTKNDGTGTSYKPSATITVQHDLVLHAIWEAYTNVPDGSENIALPTLNIASVNELESPSEDVKAIVELNGELSKLAITKIGNEGGSASTDIQAIQSELIEMNDEIDSIDSKNAELELYIEDIQTDMNNEITAINKQITTINNKNKELESNINSLVKNNTYATATGGSGTGWSASDEVAIGTWIDGKTIYRKAWQLNMDAKSKTFKVGFDRSNVDVALRMDVMCTCEQGLTPLYADTSHTTAGKDYFRAYFGSSSNSTGSLCVGGGTDSPSIPYTAIVILEYTKK